MFLALLLQVSVRRFQPTGHGCRRAGDRAFRRSIVPNHARQRSHRLTDRCGRSACHARGRHPELLGLGRHLGNRPISCRPPTTAGTAHGVGVLFEAPLNLLLGLITSMTIFLLYRTDQLVLLPPDPVEVGIGEFPPPRLQCAPQLLPLACKDVLVHRIVLHGVVYLCYEWFPSAPHPCSAA